MRPEGGVSLRPDGFTRSGLRPTEKQTTIPNIFAPTDIPGEENALASVVMAMGARGEGKTLLMTDMGRMMLDRFEQEAAMSRGSALSLLRRRKVIFNSPRNGVNLLNVEEAEERGLINACFGAGWTKEQLESGETILPCNIRVKRRLRRIMANYHVEFADFCNPNLLLLLMEYPEWAKYAYILFDELDTAASTLQSNARHTKGLVDWTHQLRKFHAEMMFTTQFPQEIAHRMLRQTNLFIRPRLMPWKQDMVIDVHDYWGHWTGDQRPKMWPIMPWDPPDDRWILFNANQGFRYYNTDEYIPSMWMASRDVLLEKQWRNDISKALEQKGEQATTGAAEEQEKSLDGMLAKGSISLTRIYDQEKAKDPSIKSTKDLAAKLESKGYHVFKNGGRFWVANKP